MAATLVLAGDTMLGRGVGEVLAGDPAAPLIAADVAARIATGDAFILNLECCISDRGTPFPDPGKRFFFRAPPVAAERLAGLGVDAVTLANNHALDYGSVALLDTLSHLDRAGVLAVGAGPNQTLARAPRIISCGDTRLKVVALADHPAEYAAGPHRAGIAFANLGRGVPHWAREAIRPGPECDAVLLTPHWGPNMAAQPGKRIRQAAEKLLAAGATLIAGHSAHVFQGVAPRILFDLGDFLDDYAADPQLRNDLGLLWLIDLDPTGPGRIRALPLALEYSFTRQASRSQTNWIARRLQELCAPFGTTIERAGDGLIELHPNS
jgi:poly-gamma-glutamate capsule biosynthesis protein CapA/YwtB (metallophosphatase superfamily)